MTLLFRNQTEDGKSAIEVRRKAGVRSGLFQYKKTGTGTAVLDLKDGFNEASLVTVSAAAGTQQGTLEVAVPCSFYAELSSVSGSVSVDAELDNA